MSARMKMQIRMLLVVTALVPMASAQPYLQKKGTAVQLVVDGKPFLMLGVETTNKLLEDPTDLPYLNENLRMYKEAGVNTVLIPVAWYSFEPQEDRYDYTMIDALIDGCRRHELKLIPLWFGAIKNGGLHFVPDWVRNDKERFFRALKPDGKETYAVSPFCQAAIEADREAFILLMRRIKEKDVERNIVIMMQPENETGCQEIDGDRDYGATATEAWNSPVPSGLLRYLKLHDGRLVGWLQEVWDRHGKRAEGTWPQVFGSDSDGQKIFMSCYTARFVEAVASTGREEYDLPMFANDWLGSLRSPGGPIGGPDFQVMDIWRFAAPTIDIYAPDIYKDDFKDWCAAFHQKGNPLMIPEAQGAQGRSAAQCWYTFVQHDGMLYAPYLYVGDEYHPDHKDSGPFFRRNHLDVVYPAIQSLSDVILEKQGRTPREMIAFLLDGDESQNTIFEERLQGYTLRARSNVPFPDKEAETEVVTPFAVVVQMAEHEFLAVGTKMALEIHKPGIRIVTAQSGRLDKGLWVKGKSILLETSEDSVRHSFTNGGLAVEQIRLTMAP